MYDIIKWKVIRGKWIWNKLWFPTANINIWLDIEDWTYKISALIENKVYKWVWAYFSERKLFEWFFFDFDKKIYEEEIEICIQYKIRENQKFDNYNELIEQIEKDVKFVKTNIDYVITFWTFDILHPWHENFLINSKLYWDKLVTIVATDNNVKKFKWKKPLNSNQQRVDNLKELKISDIVSHWEETSTLKRIKLYNPKVVCLWYDQIWFIKELEEYINKNKLDIKIIRIPPFNEQKYKSSLIRKYLEKDEL